MSAKHIARTLNNRVIGVIEMRLLTQTGWEDHDWDIGYPLPDHHTASQMIIGAEDLIPNMNDDDVNDVIYLIEKPINEALQDNENSSPADEWKLCGLMFQKTSMAQTDSGGQDSEKTT